MRFTGDDSLRFRYNDKALEIYNRENELVRVIKSGVMNFFEVALASREDSYLVACAYLDGKTNKGNLLLFGN